MKALMFNLFIIVISLVAGVIIAEMSNVALVFIKYFAYGFIDLKWSDFFKGIKVGGTGGGMLGVGIVLFRLFKVKGF